MPLSINDGGAWHGYDWRTWLRKCAVQNFRSGILLNATWMFTGQGLRLAGRMGSFLVVAHFLGPTGFGTFVACTALVAAVAPFASLGTSEVMLKYAARDRNALPAHFGNAILVTLISSLVLTSFLLAIRARVLPAASTATMLAAVAVADLLGAQWSQICFHVFAALDKFPQYTHFLGWSAAVRFLAALGLLGFTATPLHWAYLYAASAMIPAIAGLVIVSCCYSSPQFQLKLIAPSVREGFHFSTAIASKSVYDDIDKTMLARLSTVESAAIFTVAYRFIDAAMLPIQSIAVATYPDFFREGMHGVTSAFRFARRILRRTVFYGIGTTVVLFLSAGLVPLIMGTQYAESAAALRWLCPLPAIKSVHAFLTDTLTGANYQWQRSCSQIAAGVFNVFANLWIIRAFSWRGAAWSSLATDSLLMLTLYMVIRWHLRRERAAAGRAETAATPLFVNESQGGCSAGATVRINSDSRV